MDERTIEVWKKTAVESLVKISEPLSILALLRLADEFYSKEDRSRLLNELQELRERDREAFKVVDAAREALNKDIPEEFQGRAARVRKYGEEVANAQQADMDAALEARRAMIAAVTAFEKEHHLITQIARAKEAFVYQPAPRNP